MAVIQFIPRNSATKTEVVTLSVEQLVALTSYVFPFEVEVSEGGSLSLSVDEHKEMSDYLEAHGLALRAGSPAEDAHEICKTLNLAYGQGVRLSAKGRESEVAALCPQLSETEQRYCIAVGKQNLALARQLARVIFSKYGRFLA